MENFAERLSKAISTFPENPKEILCGLALERLVQSQLEDYFKSLAVQEIKEKTNKILEFSETPSENCKKWLMREILQGGQYPSRSSNILENLKKQMRLSAFCDVYVILFGDFYGEK